jgi:hypothetical protein
LKKLIVISSLLFSSIATAELRVTAGAGHQYGGILGAQFAYQTPGSQYYLSLGLVGAAVGFQTTFEDNSKRAFGLSGGFEAANSEDGFVFATYNYHFQGFTESGWVAGVGIGVRREDDGFFQDSGTKKTSGAITLDIGYKF